MKINQLLNKTPPKILFHYTSQEGLLSIINEKEVWSTKAHYLNDSTEFQYAIDLVYAALKNEKYKGERKIKQLAERVELIEDVNVCVTSFTKNGDLLSQWRGYGDLGAGYSLGLSGKSLKILAKSQSFILCPVIYEREKQESLVTEIIDHWLNDKKHIEGLSPNSGDESEFEDYIAMLAPTFKDPSFKEEQEWRLISPMLSSGLDRFSYRAGQYSLIPYYRFSLDEAVAELSPIEIFVGPSPMQEQSIRAVRSFLQSKDLISDVFDDSVVERSRYATKFKNLIHQQ